MLRRFVVLSLFFAAACGTRRGPDEGNGDGGDGGADVPVACGPSSDCAHDTDCPFGFICTASCTCEARNGASCDAPVPLAIAYGNRSGSTAGAGADTEGSCGGGETPERVYTFNLDKFTTVRATAPDAVLYLRSTCADAQSQKVCASGTLSAGLDPGTYFLFVDASDAAPYVLSLEFRACGDGACSEGETCQACPEDCGACDSVGDTCTTAIDIPPTGQQQRTGDTSEARHDYAGTCATATDGRDQVYKFTPTDVTDFTATVTPATGVNVALYLRRTTCETGDEITCNAPTVVSERLHPDTYYLFVDSIAGAGGAYTLNLTFTPSPPECGDNTCSEGETCTGCPGDCGQCPPVSTGDTCDDPILIPANGHQAITGTTFDANADYTGTCGTTANSKDRVYYFTLTERTQVVAQTSGFDTVAYLRGTDCAAGAERACDDDGGGDTGSMIDATLPQGLYFLFVDGYSGASGTYDLTVDFTPLGPGCGDGACQASLGESCTNCEADCGACCGNGQCEAGLSEDCRSCTADCGACPLQPGDTCANALTLAVFSGTRTVTGTTATANPEYAGSCGSASSSPEIVYTFNLPVESTASFETDGLYDSVMYLRSTDCNTGAEVDCDDDGGPSSGSKIQAVLPAGDYWLFVDGYGGDSGAFTLSTTFATAGCGDTLCSASEDCSSCAQDCGACCGDGTCNAAHNEDCNSCATDCGACPTGPGATCAAPIEIPATSGTYTDSGTTEGSGAANAAGCSNSVPAPERIYSFKPTERTRIQVTTAGFDTVAYLRSTTCDTGAEVACDDDSNSPGSAFDVTVDPGTYYLFMDGWGSRSGAYTLTVQLTALGACTDADADGYGLAGANAGCAQTGDDCDDTDPNTHPGAVDICQDGKSNSCAGADTVCPLARWGLSAPIVTGARHPSFAADCSAVAFTRRTSGEASDNIWFYELSDASTVRLTDNADAEDFVHGSWDLASLAMVYLRTVSGAPELWTMSQTNLAGSKAFSTVGAPSAGCFIGAGTHAGKIAYVENGALMAAPIGGAAATIAAIPCSTCTVRGVECSPTTPQVTVHTTTGGEIYLVNTDSGAVETVLTDALAGTCAAWARDGQALVLARAASTNVTAGLWVYRGAGTSSAAYEGRIATAPANAQWPAWCGNKIVYESAGDLYLILNR